MKKIILCGLLVCATWGAAWACDLCGYNVGLNPNYNENQIGVRFRYRAFVGHHSHSDGQVQGADRETYLSTELWARWCPNPRLRVQMLLPAGQNTAYIHTSRDDRVTGLGDASVLAYYQLFQKVDSAQDGWQQRLFVGAGLAVPTGKWRPKVIADYEPMIMPGIGAWSGLAALSYMVRKGRWGLGLDYNFRASTTNSLSYHFADRHNFSGNLYYQWKKGDFALLPFAGAYAEYARQDQDHAQRQRNTGGLASFATVGAEIYWKHLSLNLTTQLPMFQSLNGQQGQNKPRFNGGLFYSF